MSYLIDGTLHHADDGVTTECGLPLQGGLAEATEFEGIPVCAPCMEITHVGAVAIAEQIITENNWSGILGPCGIHLIGAGPLDVMRIALRPLAPGHRIVKPTPEQFMALIDNARCDACKAQVPDKKFWPKGLI